MDQIQKLVLVLKYEMTWSHGNKQKRTLSYLDSGVADRQGKKCVMTQEEAILSQKGDQFLNKFVVAELSSEDKENLSNLRNYDEGLHMLEDWLINTKIDKDDCLMFDDSIGEQQIAGNDTELFYNFVDSSKKTKEQQFQEKKMQVYQPKDSLDLDIQKLRVLMVNVF